MSIISTAHMSLTHLHDMTKFVINISNFRQKIHLWIASVHTDLGTKTYHSSTFLYMNKHGDRYQTKYLGIKPKFPIYCD